MKRMKEGERGKDAKQRMRIEEIEGERMKGERGEDE